MPVRDWGLAYAQFMFFFEDRFAAFVFTQLFFRPAEMIRIRWKVPHRVAALRGTSILCGAVLCLQQSVLYAPLFCNFTESFSSVCKPVVANPKIINHVLEPSECSASPKRSEHSVSHKTTLTMLIHALRNITRIIILHINFTSRYARWLMPPA